MPPAERRRDLRTGLSVPVRVNGHDPDGTAWEEMTATDDASYGGASFPLKHAHGVGQVLLISAALPRNFRRYDLTETSYKIYALVRNTRAGAEGERVAGVMFIGKVPPKGYDLKPGGRHRLPGAPPAGAGGGPGGVSAGRAPPKAYEPRPGGRYRLPDDPQTGPGSDQPGAERRHHERLQLFVNLRLRRLGISGMLEEQTVTENVSRGGAQVFTTLPVSSGETITVADLEDKVAAEALVRNVYAGPDRVTRLNLQFPDLAAFERLLHAAGAPPLPDGS